MNTVSSAASSLMEIRRQRLFSVSPSVAAAPPSLSSADFAAASLLSGDDEVYDTAFISRDSNCVAVATNSAQLRIQRLDHEESVCFGLGHTQSILCVDSPSWDDGMVASGSKDNSILFWRIRNAKTDLDCDGDPNLVTTTNAFTADKIALATGHTHSVASIAFSHSKSVPFLVSVSSDTTLKQWPLSELIVKQEKGQRPHGMLKLSSSATVVAHSKDINSVDVSANDKLCVTASMDKTAKLWHIDRKRGQLSAGGTLGGHKRGVWCARFSKNQQLVATCSGDLAIKLFSLLDNSCTRTLEGHQFAVLSILFIDNGTKLVSADGGGLVKLWDVKKGICMRTEEAHSDKIWSLRELPPAEEGKDANSVPKMRFMTGAADGHFAIWTDISEEVKAQRQAEHTKRTEDTQRLANLVEQDRLGDALLLSLDLGQPFHCLTVLNKLVMDVPQMEQSDDKLLALFRRLSAAQLSVLLDYAAQWNTNTRTYAIAQLVLNCVLKCVHPEQLLKLPNIGEVVKTFLPYSLRHYGRLTTQRKNMARLNYTFSCMRLN